MAVNFEDSCKFWPCWSCNCTGRVGDALCTAGAGEHFSGKIWSTCPYGVMADRWWRRLLEVDLAARPETPIMGWPDGYAAGIVMGIGSLRKARAWRDRPKGG
jgi:hypothetical protein